MFHELVENEIERSLLIFHDNASNFIEKFHRIPNKDDN